MVTNAKAILSNGSDDQITLALQQVLDHPDIRPYYHRIVGGGIPRQLGLVSKQYMV